MGGPLIVLDKSALQALSERELWYLVKHYYALIPPVLIAEVLGDLAKRPLHLRDPNAPLVRILAGRTNRLQGVVVMQHQQVCLGNLLGKLQMPRHRQGIVRGRQVRTADGRVGGVTDQEEKIALVLWSEGRFTDVDALMAATWRALAKRLDASQYVERLLRHDIILPYTKSIAEARPVVEDLLRTPSLQAPLLRFLIEEFQYSRRYEAQVLDRWRGSGALLLSQMAPYATFCIKVLLCFVVASRFRLVSSRPTNRIDLEYLFYLPFTEVFCSNDKMHAALVPLLIEQDQDFLLGRVLKADLGVLADEWESLDEEGRRTRSEERGFYPPENPPTMTARLWARHCKPFSPGRGSVKLTPERREALMKHLQPFLDALENREKG